jgi:hypothetical protein
MSFAGPCRLRGSSGEFSASLGGARVDLRRAALPHARQDAGPYKFSLLLREVQIAPRCLLEIPFIPALSHETAWRMRIGAEEKVPDFMRHSVTEELRRRYDMVCRQLGNAVVKQSGIGGLIALQQSETQRAVIQGRTVGL